jgi:two-component system sensor histidine kinase KdpD
MTGSADARALAFGCIGIGVFTWLYRQWPQVSNATTVALSFLVVVLFVAAAARLWVAVTTSVVSVFALNFFFLPPVGTLTIVDPQNWIALIAFLAVSLVASNLSAVARDRTREAVTRRDEVARLFDLSRDVLLITDGEAANSSLAAFIARRFDLDYVAICNPEGGSWIMFESGSLGAHGLSPADLSHPIPGTHRTVTVAGRDVRVVPLNLGTKQLGLVATAGRSIETGTLDALAGLVAIAIERAQFLDQQERRARAAARGAQVGAAGVIGPRPAHALDRDPRRGRQPAIVVA